MTEKTIRSILIESLVRSVMKDRGYTPRDLRRSFTAQSLVGRMVLGRRRALTAVGTLPRPREIFQGEGPVYENLRPVDPAWKGSRPAFSPHWWYRGGPQRPGNLGLGASEEERAAFGRKYAPNLEGMYQAEKRLLGPTGPALFDCGCSRHKVEAGLCSVYGRDGTERDGGGLGLDA